MTMKMMTLMKMKTKRLEAKKIWNELSHDLVDQDTEFYLNIQNINSIDFYFLIKHPGAHLSFGIDYKYKPVLPNEIRKLKSLTIDTLQISKSQKLLTLTLVNNDLKSTFISFVQNLINEISNCPAGQSAQELFINHIRHFYQLFEKKENPKLSNTQIRGLFAELSFLEKIITDKNPEDPIEYWKGPHNGLHDFEIGNDLYEIKSHAGTNIIRVLNEDQLAPDHSGNLYLIAYPILESEQGVTINEKINKIKLLLSSNVLIDKLYRYLNDAGYFVTHSKYYEKLLLIADQPGCFKINQNFPTAKLRSLGGEMFNISYQLDLTKCQDWRSDLSKIA